MSKRGYLMSKRTGRTSSKNNKKISSRMGVITVICCLALLAIVVLYKAKSLETQKQELQVQAAELQEQLDDAKQRHKELEQKEEYMKTDDYVESVARSQLGLVYPDEIVIKPEEK